MFSELACCVEKKLYIYIFVFVVFVYPVVSWCCIPSSHNSTWLRSISMIPQHTAQTRTVHRNEPPNRSHIHIHIHIYICIYIYVYICLVLFTPPVLFYLCYRCFNCFENDRRNGVLWKLWSSIELFQEYATQDKCFKRHMVCVCVAYKMNTTCKAVNLTRNIHTEPR